MTRATYIHLDKKNNEDTDTHPALCPRLALRDSQYSFLPVIKKTPKKNEEVPSLLPDLTSVLAR